MRVSEIITELGKDFKKEFSIMDEPLFSKYKVVYEHLVKNEEKGLLLIGSIGCGKSMMMRVIQRLFKDTECRFKWVSSSVLKDMLDECTVSEIKYMYGKDLKMDLYIDDIGVQKNKNNYGNVVNIISELIFDREELYTEDRFRTHFSSNVPSRSDNKEVDTLESIYGKRCYDRIVGMCELISWQSKSLRSNGVN